MTRHQKLQLALAIWIVAFPVIACGPAIANRGDLIGFILGGFTGLLFGSALFFPWIVGIAALYVLVRLTEEPPPLR